MVITSCNAPPATKIEFDLLVVPDKPKIVARPGKQADVAAVYALIGQHLPAPYASPEAMRFVMARNRNALTVFERGDTTVGFHAALFLGPRGLERLLLGELDTLNPDGDALVDRYTIPAAIYHWLAICPGLAAEGLLHLSHSLRQTALARANLFSRPVTLDGERRLLGFGYRPIACGTPNLHRYIRLANRPCALRQAA